MLFRGWEWGQNICQSRPEIQWNVSVWRCDTMGQEIMFNILSKFYQSFIKVLLKTTKHSLIWTWQPSGMMLSLEAFALVWLGDGLQWQWSSLPEGTLIWLDQLVPLGWECYSFCPWSLHVPAYFWIAGSTSTVHNPPIKIVFFSHKLSWMHWIGIKWPHVRSEDGFLQSMQVWAARASLW